MKKTVARDLSALTSDSHWIGISILLSTMWHYTFAVMNFSNGAQLSEEDVGNAE